MGSILDRILNDIGDIEIIDKLLSLPRSDLNSLLLELYQRQSGNTTATELLKAYEKNRFSAPSDLDAAKYHALEAKLLTSAQNMGMKTVLLSPATPLGSNSAFGYVNQHNVLSAIRGTEMLSDPTNMLAIIIADKLKSKVESNVPSLHYATTARVVRGQAFSGPASFSHFGLFCIVSSGKDSGSYSCETDLLVKHLTYYRQLFDSISFSKFSVVLQKRGGYKDISGFFAQIIETAQSVLPNAEPSIDNDGIGNGYYQGVNFKLYAEKGSKKFEIGDGGFVDWIHRMLGSKKERCLISCVALDRLLSLDDI